jgi:methylenetetrahydrofolate reductase (NADPH)
MKVIDTLHSSKNPQVSVEIIPPKRGGNIKAFHEAIESIQPFHPPFINVTSHAADVQWEEQPDGTFRRRVRRKSPGTFGLCAAIKYKYNIEPVPHILCAGFTREETEDALIELNYLGIENILAIRGDGKPKRDIGPGRSCNEFALDLVHQVVNMNRGIYQEQLIDAAKTNFCVGVAAYPEKHFESPNLNFDLDILKRKQDAGAQYAVTQMFYDNQKYFDFCERARKAGITIPIIPGLKIMTSASQLTMIPRFFHIDIPYELTQSILDAPKGADIAQIGIEWAYRQCLDLLEHGAPILHFYIMQKTRPFVRLMEMLKKHL